MSKTFFDIIVNSKKQLFKPMVSRQEQEKWESVFLENVFGGWGYKLTRKDYSIIIYALGTPIIQTALTHLDKATVEEINLILNSPEVKTLLKSLEGRCLLPWEFWHHPERFETDEGSIPPPFSSMN